MTDDLVKRLRGRVQDGFRFGDDPAIMDAEDTMLKAADRIEAMTAERDDYKRQAGIADTLARECRIHESRAEAAEKELQEMQAHIDHADAYHKAMLAAEADNARLQGMVDKCQSIAKDAVSMCNEGIPVSAKNVAMAVLRALTGNVTVGGGRVDWGDQPVAALTGKADT
jgi:capsule polysaccharide export protein KpsE/RkpR